MKFFQSSRKFYLSLGLKPPQPDQSFSLNAKNLLILFIFMQGSFLTASFLVFKASSMREFGDSFYASVTELANTVYFLSSMSKMGNILRLMENIEEFIKRSESKHWEKGTNDYRCFNKIFPQEYTIQLQEQFIAN